MNQVLVDVADIAKAYHPDLYPREKWDTSTVDRYAEAYDSGVTFPPIVLEDREDGALLVDGVHRWKAAVKAGVSAIPAIYVKRPNDIPETKSGFKIWAASLSTGHGNTIKTAELRECARAFFQDLLEDESFDQQVTGTLVAKYFSRKIRTVQDWVKDLVAKRTEDRNTKIIKLAMQGWTQEEIASTVGLARSVIAEKLSENAELRFSTKTAQDRMETGIPPEDIAKQNNWDITLATAIALDGKDDRERLDYLGIKLQPYDVWQFPKCHDLMGSQHPGRIPGELICHVLYFFTEQGDVVLDPMTGSGTTQDACLLMGRKCYGFDIDHHHKRVDVIGHDILKDSWHSRISKANLIFWDPPYFDKKDDGYVDGSISRLPKEDYLAFFAKAFRDASARCKPGTKIAFLMSDWDDGNNGGIFVWDYARLLQDAGWNLIRHIQTPLSTQQVHPDIVNKFRDSRRLARLERYLLVGIKE